MAIKFKKPKSAKHKKVKTYSKFKKDFAAMWKILLKYKRKIGKKEIQIGDILRIDYKGEFSTVPQADIIVLNPSFKRPKDKAPMLHALALRDLSPNDVQNLKTLIVPSTRSFTQYFTKKEVKNMKVGDKKKLMMLVRRNPKAQLDLMRNPKNFYYSYLKPMLKHTDDSAYRTYFVKKIAKSNIKLLDHKYAIEEF